MIRFRTSLLWFHTVAVVIIALLTFRYTGRPIPEISLLVETVHQAVTSWFYPKPLLAFFILALFGWLFSTFRTFSPIGNAIGSAVSLLLFAWWTILLGPGELLQRLPEFFLLGSVLVGLAALAPFRPVSLLILEAVRYGILPVKTLHRVLSSLNKLPCLVFLEKDHAVSTLARHAARARTDFLLNRVHESFSLKVDSVLLFDLVGALKDEYELGREAMSFDQIDFAVHTDRLSMVYSTLMLVESHQDSEYPSDTLLEMFEWDPQQPVTSCYQIFDTNPNTEIRICASSTLFKEKQWGLLLHGGESLVPYPIRAIKLRAAQEIFDHLDDATKPEYREVFARQNQLMRELHLTGSLSDGCVLAPSSPLSLSKRSESRHLAKSGFSAPFSFASLPIFDGTPGLRLATFFIVLLSAWFGTDEVGFEIGDPLRQFSTAYLPESDPRRVAQDDRIIELHTLSEQPIVARIQRAGSDVVEDGYLRIDPKNYDIDVISLPPDLASTSRVLVDSFQAANGFHILTGSSTDPKSNLAHFLLPPEGSKPTDWRTVHAPTQDFDLGTVLDVRWVNPDMQFIVGDQGICLYQPSSVAEGKTGYQFLPYAMPRAVLADALLTDSDLHLVFEYAGDVHLSQTNISLISKTFASSEPSLQSLFPGSRVLPRFEIGENFDIHPGPSDSIFVQGSQGALLHVEDDIHVVRWGQLPDLRTPEFVFLGDYALAFDQSHLLLHRSSETKPTTWWASKSLTSGDDDGLNEVSLFSKPFPDCFLAIHESDNQPQLTLLVHKKGVGEEFGRLYRFKVHASGKIHDGELFFSDVVDFSVSSDGKNCALTSRFSRLPDEKVKYEVLLTFSAELAASQNFDHDDRDRLSAFQKFLPFFDNRNQLAVRSPMPSAFVDEEKKLALSYDSQNGIHSILTSSGEIQAYSETQLGPVGDIEILSPFPSDLDISVDFFSDAGVNHVLTVRPNHQVDRWIGNGRQYEHQTFPWHLPRWGSSRPTSTSVAFAPGSNDFIISDGTSLYHHGITGGWRPLTSPVNNRPVPSRQLFSLSSDAERPSLLFSVVGDGASSTLLEVPRGGGNVQSHRLPRPVDENNSSWILSPTESPKFVFRSTESEDVARWFSWDELNSHKLLHLADSTDGAGKLIDLCDMNDSQDEPGLLILGKDGLNFCRNSQRGLTRRFIPHPDFQNPSRSLQPSQLVDSSSGIWALYESRNETIPALVTPGLNVLQGTPTLLTSSVTTDPGQGFVGLSRNTREPVRFGSSTKGLPLLPNARFNFEPDGLEVLRWLPGKDHLHLVTLSPGSTSQTDLYTLDGFGRLQQSVSNFPFDGDIKSAHLIGPTTHIFTDQSWYTLSGTQDPQQRASGLWYANSFPSDEAGLAWRVGSSPGSEPSGRALGLGVLDKLELPGAGSQASGSPIRVVPAFRDLKRDLFYLAAKRGMYRWDGVAQGFTSFQIPIRDANNIRTWLRTDRGGAPIAVVASSPEGPSFYQFDFDTRSYVDLEIDLNSWSQDSPEHAWAVSWRRSDWFADVENLRLVSKEGERWGGWSTGLLDDSPEVWNVQGQEYLLDKSGRLLRLDVHTGQWQRRFGQQKFRSIYPIPQRSTDVASEQTQFIAKSRDANTWVHLQLGRSEREYSELVLKPNSEPSYDSKRLLGFTPDGEEIIEYTWKTQRLQKYLRPATGEGRVLAKASNTSVWAQQGSLLREINLSSGQWSSVQIETKPGSVKNVAGENNLLLFKDPSSKTQYLVRSGRSPRRLARSTPGFQLNTGWDAVAFSDESDAEWRVSDGETVFRISHKNPHNVGEVRSSFIEDNNLLVVSDRGVSRFVKGEWQDVTRPMPIGIGVVNNRWCYLQDGTLFDQNRRSIPGYSGVEALFSSPNGTIVVDEDWRCTWHKTKSGPVETLAPDNDNYLCAQSQNVFGAEQFPSQGPARFLTWSNQGKGYLYLSDENPPQELNGPRPMIWLSPSHPEQPVFDRNLNIIRAKSTSDEPELIGSSSEDFATNDMLFRNGTQIQEIKKSITVRELRSSSGAQFLRVPVARSELHFERSASGSWEREPLLVWTKQTLTGPTRTSATLVRARANDSTGYLTAEDGRTQEVEIKSLDDIDDRTLDSIIDNVFGRDAQYVPDSFFDRLFVRLESGEIVPFENIESSSIRRLQSDVVPVNSTNLSLPYVIEDGDIGIRHEGGFIPMRLWDRVPTVVQCGQKAWGNFIPDANGVVSASNWLLTNKLPIGVKWSNDGTPLIQRGSGNGFPSVRSSTSFSGHLPLDSNSDWSGSPNTGMSFQRTPLGKLTPQGFESHARMQRKEFVPVNYRGSLGVVRVVNDKLWLQSDRGWQQVEKTQGVQSKVVRGPSEDVSLRPNVSRTAPVNGTLLRWEPSTNSIGCVTDSGFYPLKLAEFSCSQPFLCARPSGFGYRSARDDLVVFSYNISGKEYQSESAASSLIDVLGLLENSPGRPSRTTASVPNQLPSSRIQNVNTSLVRSRSGDKFALAWHLVDQVRPTRSPSEDIVVSKDNGPNYVIGSDGKVQGAKALRLLPNWSDDAEFPFRPASDSSGWELQLPTVPGLRQWIPAGSFDRGNFALLQLGASTELRKFDDDVWTIQHGGFSLGWSISANDFVVAPGQGTSAPEFFTTQCGSYDVSIAGGQFDQISHSDIGVLVFDASKEENPSRVTPGGWLPPFEPQNIQYAQDVAVQKKGDPDWCIQIPDTTWVTLNEDLKSWKRSGPPRGVVDPPALQFDLLADLSRKQIRANRIVTPLNIDLGVFKFEIPGQLKVGFDQQRRIVVIADNQSYVVDPASGIKLLPEAEISVVQSAGDRDSSNLVLGLSSAVLEESGTTYEYDKDGRLSWSPHLGLTFQELNQPGVFDHNRIRRAFFTTASNRMLTTFDGGFVVRGPEALSIYPHSSIEFQRDLDGELHATSIPVDCETPIGTNYNSAILPEILRRTYAVSSDGWVQPNQALIEADGRLPNSRLGWIGVYPNGVAEIVGDQSRFLARDDNGISQPTAAFIELPCEVSNAQHMNGGLFVENPEHSFAIELSEYLGLGLEGFRSVKHDWSPTYQTGLMVSTESIQTNDGRHVVTPESRRRQHQYSGVLEEPSRLGLDTVSFSSHAMQDVTTVQVPTGNGGLRLYILGSSLSRIDFDNETGDCEFVNMYDPEASDEVAASLDGDVYLREDEANWLRLQDGEPLGESQLGSRWVTDTLNAFSSTFDWTLCEDPNGVLRYSSNLHDSLKNRVLSEDVMPEWPWDRLVASGFDFDTSPEWSSTELHLRRSVGFPSPSGFLSNQKKAVTHARQKVYSEQGSAHIPVESAFPSLPSIPSRGFPLSASLQDGSLALDVENQVPVLIDLSSDVRYPVDFGDGPDAPAANAERIDDDLWILNQSGQLRWVPIMEEWLQQLVDEDLSATELPTEDVDPGVPSVSTGADTAEQQ